MSFYIVGAGGFGRETLDALRVAEPDLAASAEFLDDHLSTEVVDGVAVRTTAQARQGAFVVAIADPGIRKRIAELMSTRGLEPARVVHPAAVISSSAYLGPGAIVLANAFVSTAVRLGVHVHINYNATVGHDSILGDYTTVLPGANVAGTVAVEPGVLLGSNSCVLQGRRIGDSSIVGAGAVVTHDQSGGRVVVGVPARELRPGSSRECRH